MQNNFNQAVTADISAEKHSSNFFAKGMNGKSLQACCKSANDNDKEPDVPSAAHDPAPSLYAALGYQRRCPYQWWLD